LIQVYNLHGKTTKHIMAILLPSFAEVQKDTKFPLQHLFLLHYHNPETLIENEMLVEMYNI